MRVPVMLYDVCRGAGPEDPDAVILCTARGEVAAQALVRHLERLRAVGDLEIVGACFVRSVESAVTADSPAAATRDGYTLRYALAALPAEPLAREVAPPATPRHEEPTEEPIEEPPPARGEAAAEIEGAVAAPQGRP